MVQLGYLIAYAGAGAGASHLIAKEETETMGYIIGGIAILSAFTWSPAYIVISLAEIGLGVFAYHMISTFKKD